MTSYSGVVYLLFYLPMVLVIYSILSRKIRPYLLLLAGYGFFISVSGRLVIFLLFTTGTMYIMGLWLDSLKKQMKTAIQGLGKDEKKVLKQRYIQKQKHVVWIYVILNLGIIAVLKYSPFFIVNLDKLFERLKWGIHINVPDFVVPIGISFYTFMGISYILDVYRDVIKADRNFLRVALYMSFFPEIMEGPFARYSETAEDIYECRPITYKNLTFGCQRILYGLFKKIIIADRLNSVIVNIFASYETIDGGVSALGMVMYTIQLYCEFSGTMDIVLGTAEIFDVRLPENFKRPFFSRTISEFWTRWHITLGTWFKDYIYYPISMSPAMKNLTKKMRKVLGNHYGPLVAGTIALFAVWISNGLWHGAGWTYITFGMYHFVLITLGNMIEPLVKAFVSKTGFDRNVWWYRLFQTIRTFILVCFGELIFRGHGMTGVIMMTKALFNSFSLEFLKKERLFSMGMDKYDFIVVAIALLFVTLISILSEKGVNVRQSIAEKNICIRWLVYIALVMSIVIFGAYGMGYLPVDPIYAGF